MDASVVEEARRRRLHVQPYTVSDRDVMERLLVLGVDGLITDVPRRRSLAVDRTAALVAQAG